MTQPSQIGIVRSLKSFLVFALLLTATQLAILFVLACILFFTWGSGQLFQPPALEGRLAANMTVQEVEFALALPPDSLSRQCEQINEETFAIDLAVPGLGSWVVPQYGVILMLDKNKRLKECIVEIYSGVDEQYLNEASKRVLGNEHDGGH